MPNIESEEFAEAQAVAADSENDEAIADGVERAAESDLTERESEDAIKAKEKYVAKLIDVTMDDLIGKLKRKRPDPEFLGFVDYGQFLGTDGLPDESRIKEFVTNLEKDPQKVEEEAQYAQGIGVGRHGPPQAGYARKTLSLDARYR
ncbi:hypothetical protein [Streptomyces halobius]|uniref:Uncharacterized protein n=1 Tax=Streptomyces halobius TaxID=2879846 RepID=A0ABY4MBU4_9ACTN|nr:hypothetical protein [Streptomyces halobius]UQA95259.1 hypothetical protein K9S39_28450 [Streptomyces halobius]